MTYQDWNAQAAEALPCKGKTCRIFSGSLLVHDDKCPACFRPAVAARFAEIAKAAAEEREGFPHCLDCIPSGTGFRPCVRHGGAAHGLVWCGEGEGEYDDSWEHWKLRAERLSAERNGLQTALGQANADLMGCRDGALLRDLRAELSRLYEAVAREDPPKGIHNKLGEVRQKLINFIVDSDHPLYWIKDSVALLDQAIKESKKG